MDEPTTPDARDARPSGEPGSDAADGTPRWVWVFGGVFVLLAIAFVVLHLTGRGLGGHAP